MKKFILIVVLYSAFVALFSFSHRDTGPIIKAIKMSDGWSTTGALGGALDDGRGFAFNDSIYIFGGTDNTNVFNQFVASGDKGEHWHYHSNAPWSARNAMAVCRKVGGYCYMWGGKTMVAPVHDSWRFSWAAGWEQVDNAMGGDWNFLMTQYAFARTNTAFLTIGGAQNDSVLTSTDLITWTRLAILPDSIRNTASGYADFDSISNKLYFVGGFNIDLSIYVGKLWESSDGGVTWASILEDVIFKDQWPNIMFTTWGAVYIRGSDGVNRKGTYYWLRGTDISNINNWHPFDYELPARHATFVFVSSDWTEAYAVLGNFWNESWKFVNISQLWPLIIIRVRRKKHKHEIDHYSIAA